MLNNCLILGWVKFEPTLLVMKNGKEVCNLEIQCSRTYLDKDGKKIYDYISCRCFIPGLIKYISNYITKGTQVIVGGRFQTDLYVDRNGKNSKASYLLLEHLESVKIAQTTTPYPPKAEQKDPLDDVDW